MTTQANRIQALIAAASLKPHGSRARYVAGRCRCLECRAANNSYQKGRDQAKRWGGWNGIVDAKPARLHLQKLSRAGIGRDAIHDATDLPTVCIDQIRTGKRKRCRAKTLRKILAVDTSVRADGALVSGAQSWRLIDELLADGYTKKQLARWLGYKSPALQFNRNKITARNVWLIRRLYRQIKAGELSRDR